MSKSTPTHTQHQNDSRCLFGAAFLQTFGGPPKKALYKLYKLSLWQIRIASLQKQKATQRAFQVFIDSCIGGWNMYGALAGTSEVLYATSEALCSGRHEITNDLISDP